MHAFVTTDESTVRIPTTCIEIPRHCHLDVNWVTIHKNYPEKFAGLYAASHGEFEID